MVLTKEVNVTPTTTGIMLCHPEWDEPSLDRSGEMKGFTSPGEELKLFDYVLTSSLASSMLLCKVCSVDCV